MQLDSWITEVLKWVRFAKKAFFSSSPPPCKLNKVSFANALRPDSPSRKFREQQNYSENSESTEGTESTEETESAEETEAPVSEPASDRHSCLSSCACKAVGLYAKGRQKCLSLLAAGRS